MGDSRLHFVRQQGFKNATEAGCRARYPALMFQPRVVGLLALVGLVTQAPALFLALGLVLIWNVAVPRLNPFDALYNGLLAKPRSLEPLTPALPPRRFSQGMAALFTLGIGFSLVAANQALALVFECFLVVALLALIFGRFCLGSHIFYLIRGEAEFANRTLPWSKST